MCTEANSDTANRHLNARHLPVELTNMIIIAVTKRVSRCDVANKQPRTFVGDVTAMQPMKAKSRKQSGANPSIGMSRRRS